MINRIFNAFDWILIKVFAYLIILLQAFGLAIVGMWKAFKTILNT